MTSADFWNSPLKIALPDHASIASIVPVSLSEVANSRTWAGSTFCEPEKAAGGAVAKYQRLSVRITPYTGYGYSGMHPIAVRASTRRGVAAGKGLMWLRDTGLQLFFKLFRA